MIKMRKREDSFSILFNYISFRFIYDWVYSGVFRDVYGEFMIQVNEDYLCFRGTVCILSVSILHNLCC